MLRTRFWWNALLSSLEILKVFFFCETLLLLPLPGEVKGLPLHDGLANVRVVKKSAVDSHVVVVDVGDVQPEWRTRIDAEIM